MNGNARWRIEAAKRRAEQERRDANYRAKCAEDGLTVEQRFYRAMGILGNVTLTFSLADARRVYHDAYGERRY